MNLSIFYFALLLSVDRVSRLTVSASTETQNQQHDYYKVKPVVFGVEVFGIKLNDPVPQEAIDQIKKDLQKYRIMIFRDQGQVSGKRQAEIGKWFGELDTPFNRHPMSPDHDVLRLSNDAGEGIKGVGYRALHIDGANLPMPYSHALYHMYHVPKRAATVFAPIREVIEGLSKEQLQRWERLWMATISQTKAIHPVIYSHPATDEKTLCFHLSSVYMKHLIWDYGTPVARITGDNETAAILREIEHEFTKDGAIQYSHKWKEEGDFIMSDNLSVVHVAGEGSQLNPSEIGLRVLHRTTIKGTKPPTKNYDVPIPKEPMFLQGKDEL